MAKAKVTKSEGILQNYLPIKNFKWDRKTALILLVAGLLLLAVYKKSWFVAATVNGQPISNFELLDRMNQQFRDQTLNQMVNEKILLQEAAKKRIVVTEADINSKIAELENNLGGAQNLDNILAQQGQNRSSIRQQLKMQILIEKLYTDESTVSAQMVDDFIRDNPDQLRATESAEQQIEAKEILTQQKLSEIFNEKFGQLKQAAKINIF